MSLSLSHNELADGGLSLKTWQLFFLILIINMAASWVYNEYIFTRDVYHNLLAERLEANRIDQYFDFARKVSLWGYLLQPLLFLLQLGFLALLLQTPLMLMFIEIPFRRLFRINLIASSTMCAAIVAQLLKLSFYHPSEITNLALKTVPFSFASFVNASAFQNDILFLLGKLSVFEFVWCFLVYRGLVGTGKIRNSSALLLVVTIWIALLVLQWGIVVYFERINA